MKVELSRAPGEDAFTEEMISSPKRNMHARAGWEGFFPYYAGFPESFARELLQNAGLTCDSIILDPWNGSGTTTYSAAKLGLASIGYDLNPVMVVIARARLLPPSEADSLEPLAAEITRQARQSHRDEEDEPLHAWFTDEAAAYIRGLEQSIEKHLVGRRTLATDGPSLDRISGIAATLYVALFTVCREYCSRFRSSNPTWFKISRSDDDRMSVTQKHLGERFVAVVRSMAAALDRGAQGAESEYGACTIKIADTATVPIESESVDFLLTSPPYCTRIDYTAATRVELALLYPLLRLKPSEIARRMIGSTRVPQSTISISPEWGSRCAAFLETIRNHPSKASASYYYKTHVDYFSKMAVSIARLAAMLKRDGRAVLVVQDSYYKDVHNDLPSIVTDIAEAHGLALRLRRDFRPRRSMSHINPHTKAYARVPGAVEAVLCFRK